MPTSTNEFKHESLQDHHSIAQYLRSLSEGFLHNRIAFRSEQSELILEPRGLLKLKVEAKQKSDRTKLSIKISWSHE